jgi:hypothetical protein
MYVSVRLELPSLLVVLTEHSTAQHSTGGIRVSLVSGTSRFLPCPSAWLPQGVNKFQEPEFGVMTLKSGGGGEVELEVPPWWGGSWVGEVEIRWVGWVR